MVVWETTYGTVTPEGKSSKHLQNKRNIMKTRIAERKRSVGILSEYLRNGHFDFYVFTTSSLKVLTRGHMNNQMYLEGWAQKLGNLFTL